MSFPRYKDIVNEVNMINEKKYNDDIKYINKVMDEHYIAELAKNINKYKFNIADKNTAVQFDVVVRDEDRGGKIHNIETLCNTMNQFLAKNGFKFRSKVDYFVGMTKDYIFCQFNK